jgi:hypothetical protein
MNTLTRLPTFSVADRAKAAGIHFGLTALVALLAAGLVFGIWYPFPYREVAGGRELFLLIVGIDIVIGPLLTFAIFDLAKGWRLLRRDFAVIGLLQVAALAYGLHTVYLARPVYLAHEVDRFRVVTAADIDPADMKDAAPGFGSLPIWGPQLIGTRQPANGDEFLRSVDLALQGKDVALRPGWWQPFELSRDRVLQKARPMSHLRSKYPQRTAELDALVKQAGAAESDLRVLPLVGRSGDWAAVIDAKTARPLAYGPFDAF